MLRSGAFRLGDTHNFPPPKFQTREDFFDDEFFYPSKSSKNEKEI